MTLGEILEWFAAVALVAAAFIGCGLALALATTGVCLAYFAQCHSSRPLRKGRDQK